MKETRKIITEIKLERQKEVKKNGEDRSPALWRKKCLETFKNFNPLYGENPLYKKSTKYFEFLRRDSSGLIISQNFIRVGQKEYRHSFSLMLTSQKMFDYAFFPFHLGARFSNRYGEIRWAIEKDLNLTKSNPKFPREVHSSYNWGANTFKLMEKTIDIAEQYLLPFYRTQFIKSSSFLYKLYIFAIKLLQDLNIDPPSVSDIQAENSNLKYFAHQNDLNTSEYEDWGKWKKDQYIFILALIKQGELTRDYIIKKGHLEEARLPEGVTLLDVIIWYAPLFLSVREELPNIINLTDTLRKQKI